MIIKVGLVVFLLGFVLPMAGGDTMSGIGGIFFFVGITLMGVGALKGRGRSDGTVAENNAKVILNVYNQLLHEGGKKNETTLLKLCYIILQNKEHAYAALDFAKRQAQIQKEELALPRVAFAILVGQMHTQSGAEPTKDEKLIAYAAVKKVIGWRPEASQASPALNLTHAEQSLFGEQESTLLRSGSKVGLGGWLTVFIINVIVFTLTCLAAPVSMLTLLITGDYNPDSSMLLMALLVLYPTVVAGVGVWLLVLLAKRRKSAVKVGTVFSVMSFGILWAFYLHDSKRVKNTLIT